MSQEVVQVVGTGDDGIWVEGVQQSACGACSARAGCGQHTLSKMGKPVRLWVNTADSFTVGEQVTIMLPSGSLAVSALAMYGLDFRVAQSLNHYLQVALGWFSVYSERASLARKCKPSGSRPY